MSLFDVYFYNYIQGIISLNLNMQDKLKILYISPHLSTGGLPQYLWKKIEVFNDVGEIYCVEYDYLGDAYIVQRNRIKELLGDRFIPIFSDGVS